MKCSMTEYIHNSREQVMKSKTLGNMKQCRFRESQRLYIYNWKKVCPSLNLAFGGRLIILHSIQHKTSIIYYSVYTVLQETFGIAILKNYFSGANISRLLVSKYNMPKKILQAHNIVEDSEAGKLLFLVRSSQ